MKALILIGVQRDGIDDLEDNRQEVDGFAIRLDRQGKGKPIRARGFQTRREDRFALIETVRPAIRVFDCPACLFECGDLMGRKIKDDRREFLIVIGFIQRQKCALVGMGVIHEDKPILNRLFQGPVIAAANCIETFDRSALCIFVPLDERDIAVLIARYILLIDNAGAHAVIVEFRAHDRQWLGHEPVFVRVHKPISLRKLRRRGGEAQDRGWRDILAHLRADDFRQRGVGDPHFGQRFYHRLCLGRGNVRCGQKPRREIVWQIRLKQAARARLRVHPKRRIEREGVQRHALGIDTAHPLHTGLRNLPFQTHRARVGPLQGGGVERKSAGAARVDDRAQQGQHLVAAGPFIGGRMAIADAQVIEAADDACICHILVNRVPAIAVVWRGIFAHLAAFGAAGLPHRDLGFALGGVVENIVEPIRLLRAHGFGRRRIFQRFEPDFHITR